MRGYFVEAQTFIEAQNGALSPDNPQFVRAQKACPNLAGGVY